LIALICVMAQLLLHRHLTPEASSWPAAIICIKQQAAPLKIAAMLSGANDKEQAPPAKSASYFGHA
jgi:hypothetical protein